MSLLCYKSLCNKSILRTLASIPSKVSSQPYAGSHKVKYVKHESLCSEDYLEKNMRLRRPTSPHLAIYSVQITSLLSFMHRFSGVVLTSYAMTLGIGALLLPHEISHYVTLLEDQEIPVLAIYAVKTILAAPLCYHFSNGIRHLIWDLGKMLKLESVFRSGYFVIAFTILSTAWMVSL